MISAPVTSAANSVEIVSWNARRAPSCQTRVRRLISPRTKRTITSAINGNRKTAARFRFPGWTCRKDAVEKPKRYPPTTAAQTERVRYRHRRKPVHAPTAGMSSIATL